MSVSKMGSIRLVTVGALLAGSSGIATVAKADEPTLATAPAVVVATVPQAGAVDVDAGPTEIRVTFSKPMKAGGWSWSKVSDASFPKLNGQPSYADDHKTAVLPVVLDTGKTYTIWLNLAPAQNFTDEQGQKALPYALVFSTR